jgi:hypothetical protein
MIPDENTEQRRCKAGRRLDAVGWALFFIWVGVIMLVKAIPRGVGALGVGVIVLGIAAARAVLRESISMFWVAIGTLFLLAGVGELTAIDLPLLPVTLIVCGVLLLFHQRSKKRGG